MKEDHHSYINANSAVATRKPEKLAQDSNP